MEFYDHSKSTVQLNQGSLRRSLRRKSISRRRKEIVKEVNERSAEEGRKEDETAYPSLQSEVSYVEAPETVFSAGVIREREKKWLQMLQNWDRWMTRSKSKVRERCRKGIPPSLRGLAWQYLSGAVYMKRSNSGLFSDLESRPNEEWGKIIWKDIPRTFPYHHYFVDGSSGQQELFRVLSAYSLYDPNIGYSQAMAPVAAVLVMHMPAEDAFWVMVSICKKYMVGYYGPKLEAIQLDGQVFARLLRQYLPPISRHLEKNKVDPLLYIVEWMMCLFCRSLPFSTVLRLWDMFFFEGIKVLFRTSLAIVKLVFPTYGNLNHLSDDYEVVQKLVNLPLDVTHEDVIIPQSFAIKLKEKDLEKYHAAVWQENPDLVF